MRRGPHYLLRFWLPRETTMQSWPYAEGELAQAQAAFGREAATRPAWTVQLTAFATGAVLAERRGLA